MKRVKKILAMLVLISFSFCSLGSEVAFAAVRSVPPRPGVRPPGPPSPQPRPPQPRPPQPNPPRPVLPHPRPPRPMPPPPPPPFYRHRPDYRYDWGYRDWGYRDWRYRDHGRRYHSSRYEKVGFMLGAIVLLGGILSSINTSEPTHKTPETLPPPKTTTNSDIEKLRAELKAKEGTSSVPQTDNLELQKLTEDLREELSKNPVNKEKAMKIYMALRKKEQELADEKFYDYLDSVK